MTKGKRRYKNRKEQKQRQKDRKERFESRLMAEKAGPVLPDDDGSLRNNIQHLMILKSMNHRWEGWTGQRRRRIEVTA